jgi:hypothetical protein
VIAAVTNANILLSFGGGGHLILYDAPMALKLRTKQKSAQTVCMMLKLEPGNGLANKTKFLVNNKES